ncbi:hypothetical protein L7F22_004678 [Adiantum nelumboides]|nr:hypothetical protein [Adiantum nelumboides]
MMVEVMTALVCSSFCVLFQFHSSCSSRKEVRKLQKECERLRNAYAAEFQDGLSDDDDRWVGLEMDIHHVGIPKVEEKEMQKEVGQESLKLPLDTPTLPLECAHRVETEYPLLKLMLVLSLVNEIYYSEEKQIIHIEDVVLGNQRPFEEVDNDNCQQQMEDVHANADIMAEFYHFKRTSKQMSKEDVKTAKQQLHQQGPKDDNIITEKIEDDDIHIGIDKASQILEDAECDSGSNLDFNSDSVSNLDLDSTAILDTKTNLDANFNGSCGKLDEENKYEGIDRALLYKGHEEEYPKCQILVQIQIEIQVQEEMQMQIQILKVLEIPQWMLRKAKDIAVNNEVIFGNIDGAEFYHGIQHNQRSVLQVLDHGKVKKRIQEDFQELARDQSPLHNSFINLDRKEFPAIKFIQEDSIEECFAINEQAVLSNNRTNIFAIRFVQEDFMKIEAKLDEVHQNMFLTKCYDIHILEGKAFMSHFVEVAKDQEFHSEAFKDVILMPNVQLNFGYVLVVGFDTIQDQSNRKERNVAGGVEVAVGIQDLQNDLKSGNWIAKWQTEFGLRIWNVWQMENERLVAEMEELKNKSMGIEVSAWGLRKWKSELSSGVLEPNWNLAVGAESDVEKQVDPNFVAKKAVETDAKGVAGEQTT